VALKAAIAALFIYPVKSCRGIEVASSEMTERGLAHDREWMIVDAAGRFLSQRELPALALIGTNLSGGALELTAPGRAPIAITGNRAGRPLPVTVWRDTLTAIDQGEEAAEWLSTALGRDLRLVRFDAKLRRACDRRYVGDSGAHTGFADAYPLLVLSEASIADLNARLSSPLTVDRFRPNLLVSGVEAYDEDHIDEMVVGPVRMRLVKPCTRCQITTTDQQTAERGPEPLVTLAAYRFNARLDGVAFGVNAMPIAGYGTTIARGAAVDCSLRF